MEREIKAVSSRNGCLIKSGDGALAAKELDKPSAAVTNINNRAHKRASCLI
jgi:hypothetical protein